MRQFRRFATWRNAWKVIRWTVYVYVAIIVAAVVASIMFALCNGIIEKVRREQCVPLDRTCYNSAEVHNEIVLRCILVVGFFLFVAVYYIFEAINKHAPQPHAKPPNGIRALVIDLSRDLAKTRISRATDVVIILAVLYIFNSLN